VTLLDQVEAAQFEGFRQKRLSRTSLEKSNGAVKKATEYRA
jgi:hypothetical protein